MNRRQPQVQARQPLLWCLPQEWLLSRAVLRHELSETGLISAYILHPCNSGLMPYSL
jgi:hypothetical protein